MPVPSKLRIFARGYASRIGEWVAMMNWAPCFTSRSMTVSAASWRFGDSAAAAQRFVEAAERHPEAASAILLAAARVHAARNDAKRAIPVWQRIVERYASAPEAAEAELEWARALRRGGDTAGAISHLEHLILNAPESALLPQARRELDLVRGSVPP